MDASVGGRGVYPGVVTREWKCRSVGRGEVTARPGMSGLPGMRGAW